RAAVEVTGSLSAIAAKRKGPQLPAVGLFGRACPIRIAVGSPEIRGAHFGFSSLPVQLPASGAGGGSPGGAMSMLNGANGPACKERLVPLSVVEADTPREKGARDGPRTRKRRRRQSEGRYQRHSRQDYRRQEDAGRR